MAWQLIYTSAPRLLEAGRSGFGTVARHRAIPNLLVGAIERISQFSRLPGLADHRMIYSHRHISVSGIRFHVISRISDAGADYTGRTNHIAHHLIVDPKEIANSPVTPADLLLLFGWKTGWSDPPCYLDAAEEVSLGSFQRRVRLPASCWGHVAGNKRYAALLVGSEVSRGCSLLYTHDPNSDPSQQLAVHLFGESLLLTGERMWSFPFTTNLQPSDDAADFLWSGVWANSPVRNQIEQRERTIFSLAQGGVVRNGSSRQILVPTGVAADLAETGRTAIVEPIQKPAVVPAAISLSAIPEQPVIPQVSETRRATTIGPVSTGNKVDARQFVVPAAHQRNLWIPAVVVAGVAVVVLSVFGYSYLAGLWETDQRHRNDVQDSLSEVPGHTDSDADELIKEMGDYNQSEVDSIKILANNWQRDLATTAGNKYMEIEKACTDLQNIKQPRSVCDLVVKVNEWLKLRDRVINDVIDDQSYDDYASLCNTIKVQDSTAIGSDDIAEALLQYNTQRRTQFLLKKLEGYLRPTNPFTLEWFQERLSTIQRDIPKSYEGNADDPTGNVEQLSETISLWSALQMSKKTGKEMADLKADRFHDNDKAPEWLKKDYADFETWTAQKQAGSFENEKKVAQDGNAAKNDTQTIYIVLGDEGLKSVNLPFDVQELENITVEKDGQSYPLGMQTAGLFNSGGKCFQIANGKLIHISLGTEPQPQPEYSLSGTDPHSLKSFKIRVLDKPLVEQGGLSTIILNETGHQIITLDGSLTSWKQNMRLPEKSLLKLPSEFEHPLSLGPSEALLAFNNYEADISPILTKMMEKRKQLDSQLNQPAPAASHAPPADYQTKVDGKLDTLRENVHTEGIKNQLPKNGEKVNDVINELTNLSRYTPDVISDKEKPVLARDVQLLKEAADELKKIPDTQIISSNSAEGNNEMQEQLKSLNENPLLKDRPKLPGGLYTVVVIADDGSENTLIEFTIPSP